ncbi:hypothetical protein [Bradyrhizobium sp. BR 1433]|uniref:hypothetical protein n=1 Tax=Bradyrhizobium sp. BR 1433 TaxID=3447967 RepID=UPI003EE629A3
MAAIRRPPRRSTAAGRPSIASDSVAALARSIPSRADSSAARARCGRSAFELLDCFPLDRPVLVLALDAVNQHIAARDRDRSTGAPPEPARAEEFADLEILLHLLGRIEHVDVAQEAGMVGREQARQSPVALVPAALDIGHRVVVHVGRRDPADVVWGRRQQHDTARTRDRTDLMQDIRPQFGDDRGLIGQFNQMLVQVVRHRSSQKPLLPNR